MIRIFVTGGTFDKAYNEVDTLIETAGVLATALGVAGTAAALGAPLGPDAGKTIVLTGAMVPYAFGSSDGLFNLGSALSCVQILPRAYMWR